MNIKCKTMTVFSILSTILGFFPQVIFAEDIGLKILADRKIVQQGDTVNITVAFSSEGESIGTLAANITYDKRLMEYKSGGSNAVELSNGIGGISDNGSSTTKKISYTFKFLAKKTGKANFAVTSSEVIGYNSGNLLGKPQKNTTIDIIQTEEEKELTPIETQDSEGKTLFLLRELHDIKLPQAFEATTLSYDGQAVAGAKNPSTGMLLLYAMDNSQNEDWYIYDDSGSIYPYINVNVEQNYILLPINVMPVGYEIALAEFEGKKVSVLKPDKGFNGFYLMYAINDKNTSAYYFYDDTESTMQRVWMTTEESKSIPSSSNKLVNFKDNKEWTLIITVMAGIYLLLLVLVILLSLYYKTVRNKKN